MSKLNWLDRAISFVAPKTGADRARARQVIRTYENLLKRKYEGATSGRRVKNWFTSGSNADGELYPAASILRNRSRDLVRNNAYAARGVGVIQANTVGTGILCQVRPSPQTPGKKPLKADLARAAEIQAVWSAWADSTDCDADGINNFYGLQALVMRVVVESGECLVRRRRRRLSGSGMEVPLQLQVLEPDYLDSSKQERLPDGGYIIAGIEFDKRGQRVAYWLFTEHPGGQVTTIGFVRNTIRVDASEILHIYRQGRAGQTRGEPWMAPVMLRMRDFDEYEDAQLVRQKLASCFTAFVRDIETGEMSDEQIDLAEKMEPGLIEMLPPGKDVTLASPPGVQNYKEYSTVILHSIAAGLGITYEAMTGDYSQVNFSSARMGQLEMQRNIDSWRWNMLIPLFCKPVFQWFADVAQFSAIESFDGIEHDWTPPARQLIDPLKENLATKTAIRSGLATLSETLRERGYDPDKHFAEYAADLEKLDKLGIVLDTDARHTSGTGQASDQTAALAQDEQAAGAADSQGVDNGAQ